MQLNDKEEALAHQRKVSYMLSRALEDKNSGSKENKEKNPMKDNFPLKNPWQKTTQFSVLRDPVHSSVQIFNSVGCICSIQHLHTDQNYTSNLKRSRSLPSNMFWRQPSWNLNWELFIIKRLWKRIVQMLHLQHLYVFWVFLNFSRQLKYSHVFYKKFIVLTFYL